VSDQRKKNSREQTLVWLKASRRSLAVASEADLEVGAAGEVVEDAEALDVVARDRMSCFLGQSARISTTTRSS
jgi:hypothetical protein